MFFRDLPNIVEPRINSDQIGIRLDLTRRRADRNKTDGVDDAKCSSAKSFEQ